MVFEKVTLSVDQKADQKVVKIGFLNIATNHWITVNDQGIVTLQVNLYNNQILNCRTLILCFENVTGPSSCFFEAHTFLVMFMSVRLI